MCKISIVLPYWKGPAYLEDCVASLEQQELTDYEILLICDKGGDYVPEAVSVNSQVQIYSAEKVTKGADTIEKDEPFGVAFCRNIGLSKATGDYVYFIDCDDYLLEEALPRLLKLAEEKNALMVTGNKYSSWFRPCNFDFKSATQETRLEGIVFLEGAALEERFRENFSAQHLLIRRELLQECGITFDTEAKHYSDMSFVLRVLKAARGKMWAETDSLYVARCRNDRIHLPALSQQEDRGCGGEFITCYERSLEFLKEEDGELKYLLSRSLIHFFLSRYPKIISDSEAGRYRRALRGIPERKKITREFREFPFFLRRKLRLFCAGHYRLSRFASRCHTVVTKKKGLFGSKIQWYRVIEHLIFRRLPVKKNWVLFESFFGKSYSDSPKYLYEYLQKTRGDKYRYIWILNEQSGALKQTGKHTVCRLNSLRYVYYMTRCGYRIFNVRQPSWCKKREGVVFLETWHGTPLKKLAFDLEDVYTSNQNLKAVFYEQGKEWNYLVSANRFSTDVFERAFGYERSQILEYGYPRNDILYADNKEEIAAEVKKELGIPLDKRVILYAPTWRDNQPIGVGKYSFTLALNLEGLREEFGSDTVLLLRTHYYIADMLDLSAQEGFVYNGSQYEDVSRLYLASDICITDYSSVFFDFANLKRPIFFFTYDYEEYADEIRGLYIDMDKELPGPVVRTNEELIEALHRLEEIKEQYHTRYEEFYNRFCHVDDGRASERVIEKVFGEREGGTGENAREERGDHSGQMAL
ncbi:MAG: CDP-glycerol:glycerophosphate glycerophosphotransferase [Lachnospiraceae bacterium]|nr:CDP-glycerol:glycerophosphate glycerophosphotransferase [Lachnospiraceae bacterium]